MIAGDAQPADAAATSISEHVQLVGTHWIIPTQENWTIYRKPDPTDPTFVELCDSIEATGVNTPLELSRDYYILSGHRRYAAARECGLHEVPCIIDCNVVMGALSSPERIALLIERNKGVRVKSDGELYREAAASVDPEAAVRVAQARKAQVFNKAKISYNLTEVEETGGISRTDPNGERSELLAAVLEILAEKRAGGYLPTSGRSIHYKLLAKNVRTSTRKNGYIYGTRPGSSSLLSKLLTDARSEGLIDPDDMDDSTRPTHAFKTNGSRGQYINKELDGLFQNYFSDIHADQPIYAEILVEKNAIFPLLVNHVANSFRLPITSLRGYGGFPAARDVARRFKESGKEKLAIIYVSDLDPEGVNMPASWKKYLLHDFDVDATVYRAAVTPEQVEKYNLPPDADVKLSSTRAAGFMQEYGDQCWELDSMPEEVLIDEVSTAVRAVLDTGALNRAFEAEKQSDVSLARLAAKVRAFADSTLREAAP